MKESLKTIAITTVVTAAISFFVFSGFSAMNQPQYTGCGGSSTVASGPSGSAGCCTPQ
jgi:FlaG/FlaF family flagellin (archaellin)